MFEKLIRVEASHKTEGQDLGHKPQTAFGSMVPIRSRTTNRHPIVGFDVLSFDFGLGAKTLDQVCRLIVETLFRLQVNLMSAKLSKPSLRDPKLDPELGSRISM